MSATVIQQDKQTFTYTRWGSVSGELTVRAHVCVRACVPVQGCVCTGVCVYGCACAPVRGQACVHMCIGHSESVAQCGRG